MRTIIDLPEHQVAALAELCQREKISRAEAVRRALDVMLAAKQATSRHAAFGAWAARPNRSNKVRALREEWQR
jgi:metal-responsive CopG/Arc/MetJ family transcriptional regulator